MRPVNAALLLALSSLFYAGDTVAATEAQLAAVQPSDTLWKLATQARPDNQVAMVQVVYALWQANPQAFRHNNINYLLHGSKLSVPSRQQMLALPLADARQWYYQAIASKAPFYTETANNSSQPAPTEYSHVDSQDDANRNNQADATDSSTPQPSAASELTSKQILQQRADNTEQRPAAVSTAAATTPAAAEQHSRWRDNISADYSLTAEQRYYPQQGAQQQAKAHTALALSAEWAWQSDDRSQQWVLQPYLRWDQRDTERNLIDLRQAYWQYAGSGFDIKAGVDIVFWGVTESQHLVDVINQTDAVASVDGEAKLGQPMLNWNLYGDGGTFSLYLLPYFRERPLAGPDGRLKPPLFVDSDNSQYESAQAERNLDFALRWSQQFGAVDLALSYFEGNNRDPLLQMTASGMLQPVYLQMQQFGLETQLISGSWIWKLESIYRKTRQEDFAAATAGFEYTQVGLFGSNWDLGWIAEYQYDSRDQQAPVPGQNDLFLGGRFAANDAAGTELLLGIVQDLDNSDSQSGKLEASMRLSNNLRLQLDAWFFRSNQPVDPLHYIRRDDFFQLSLDYYF